MCLDMKETDQKTGQNQTNKQARTKSEQKHFFRNGAAILSYMSNTES